MRLIRAIATACVLAVWASTLFAQARASYLYTLSDFSGRLRYDSVRLSADRERGETYFLYQNVVRIFNASGMEIYNFGDDLDLGHIVDLAVDSNGDIILLSYRDSRTVVTRCTFRGVPIAAIEIKNLPAEVPFEASRMIHRAGLFYFVSLAELRVIVTDANGDFRQHIELSPLLDADARLKGSAEMSGFTVDGEGNLFFTMPTLFKVYKYTPDGRVTSFGRPGSPAGRFGVIAGVATDSQGNVLIADKLKCVVMVFDKNFRFLSEFGYRGARSENLVAPDEIVVDAKDRVYVSQARRRGVSVFALSHQ